MTSTTTKMALNNSISVDRDALREQQRQARAQMMDPKDPPSNTAGLFAEPIFRVVNASDDPLKKQIQRTLGDFDALKDTISCNPKNLIGITSQPQTPLPGAFHHEANLQLPPHFPDVLKPPKPPYLNGHHLKTSSGGGSGGHHHHGHHHHNRSGGGSGSSSSGASSRLNSGSTGAVTAPRSGNNGWNNNISQAKQQVENYGTAKQKATTFKPHSPVPQSQFSGVVSSLLGSVAPPPPAPPPLLPTPSTTQETVKTELTVPNSVVRDQCSPARPVDKTAKSSSSSAQISQQQTHHHPPPASNSTSVTVSTSKCNTADQPRVNGVIANGAVKPGYGRTGPAKPQLRLNIDEATKANQDQAELENILKEMIAPTPLTAIPTPRKDETKFAFSAVANHLLTNSPSDKHQSSKSAVTRSLDKTFPVSGLPLPAGHAKSGSGEILDKDLEISEDSDEDEGLPGRKLPTGSRNGDRSVGPEISKPPPQVTSPASESTSSDTDESSSCWESESKSDPSDDEAKPTSPKAPDMNWNLNNFMPTQPEIPFGLPSDAPLPVSESRPRHNSSNSTNKTNVCDPSSRRQMGRALGQVHNERDDDDDDFCPVPNPFNNVYVQDDIKTLITSPQRDSLSGLGRYHRSDEVFSKVIQDVPLVSPPLSPQSPPHPLPPAQPPPPSSSRSLMCQSKKKSSLSSPRNRSPAAAATHSSNSTISSSQSRESKHLVNRELKETVGAKKGLLPDPIREGSTSEAKGETHKVKQRKHKSEKKIPSESKTKDKKSGAVKDMGSDASLNKEEIVSRKFTPSVTKRPRTPPGPPPPSPPPVVITPSVTAPGKSLARQNSSGSSKGSVTPVSSSRSSKPSTKEPTLKSNSLSTSSLKVPTKSERKEVSVSKYKKSPHGKRSKTSNKIKSKEIISDASDSDSDADIDVGVGSSPAQPPITPSKTPTHALNDRSTNKGLAKPPHSSSSTSLSSVADSIDELSTATGTVLSSKSKSTSGRHSNSSSASVSVKGKSQPQSASKSSSSVSRDASKSSSSSKPAASNKGGNAVSLAEEMSLKTAPLSPLSKDDFKEERPQLKAKDSVLPAVKIASLVYRNGVPSLMISFDKSLLDRVPTFPPVQQRLGSDASPSSTSKKVEPPGKKVKTDHKRLENTSPITKSESKQKQSGNHDVVGGKENNQVAFNANSNNNIKSDVKTNKRPLQDPDVWKYESKKLKLSSSKEKTPSSESPAQTSHKLKSTPNERSTDIVKIKKDELQSEDVSLKSVTAKSSPASRLPRSPAELLDKKAKGSSSGHKNSPSTKREKKRSSLSSSSSTSSKKEKSSRENDGSSNKVEAESESSRAKKSSHEPAGGAEVKKDVSFTSQGDFSVGGLNSSSSLTVQSFSKESKLRERDTSEVTDAKKWKGSGSGASSASQTPVSSILTDTQKAITSEGIERNTNHDRIPSANEFTSSKSASSASASTFALRDAILERIDEVVDVRGHSSDEFYLNHAKFLKHEADKETDRTAQVLKYLHAVLYFILTGMAMEERTQPKYALSIYTNTLDLIKFILSKFRSNQSTNANVALENKLAVLSLWCQSILNLRLYNVKRNEVRDFQKTLAEYQKTPLHRPGNKLMTSPGQSSSTNAVPTTLWSSKTNGAPSPMSPLPSPAGSVGSVESQSSGYSSSEIGQQQQQSRSGSASGNGGGSSANSAAALTNPAAAATHFSLPTISIPVHIHSTMQNQLINLNFLSASHDSWEQAEALLIRGGNQDYFTGLDQRCGKLELLSSLRELVRYVMRGLHILDPSILS